VRKRKGVAAALRSHEGMPEYKAPCPAFGRDVCINGNTRKFGMGDGRCPKAVATERRGKREKQGSQCLATETTGEATSESEGALIREGRKESSAQSSKRTKGGDSSKMNSKG